MVLPVVSGASDGPASAAPPGASATTFAGRGLWATTWLRVKRDKVALAGLAVVCFFIVVAIFAPLLCKIFGVDATTTNPPTLDEFGFPKGAFGGASWDHPLGVEPGLGRDVFARTVYGARYSLLIALSATVLTVLIGVVMGIVSGYFGGAVDTVLGRIMDVLLAFPVLLFSIAFLVIVGTSDTFKSNNWRIVFIIFIIGFFSWPYIGRIVRGQVLSLREKEFVEAARSLGAGNMRVLFTELLPNLAATILVYSTLIIPTNVLYEAALSFLGVGLQSPTPSWGGMLSDAVSTFKDSPFYMFVPGISIFLVVLGFNLFGDGLRDALDPRAGR